MKIAAMIGVLIAVTALFFASASRSSRGEPPFVRNSRQNPGQNSEPQALSATAPENSIRPPKSPSLETAFPEPPKPDAVRADLRQNPDQTPPHLLLYAAKLGEQLQKAVASEELARQHIERMRACVNSQDSVPAAQVLCLRHAELLGVKFPVLEPLASDLAAAAPEEVKRVAFAMEDLRK